MRTDRQTSVEAVTKGVVEAEGAGDAEAGDDCDDAAEPGLDSSSPALSPRPFPRPRPFLPLLGRLHPETVASFDTSAENERQVCVGMYVCVSCYDPLTFSFLSSFLIGGNFMAPII